jgi:DNA repair protein RecN (Recombination protein N)
MLLDLTISNYAIIDELTLNPSTRLNIVTGETGAGKSIIIGALSLILGERADTTVLINKTKKCIVEATFSIENNSEIIQALKSSDIDIDDTHCIIRREIATNGKSRAFINDTPVTLSILASITENLIDLHRQFDHQSIDQEQFQFKMVDAIAQNHQDSLRYQDLFREYQNVQHELHKKEKLKKDAAQEASYKQFLFEELDQAKLIENEIESIEVKLKQANAAERIITSLNESYYTLEEADDAIINQCKKQLVNLQQVVPYFEEVGPIVQRIEQTWLELKDISNELQTLRDNFNDLDIKEVQVLEDRFDLCNRLLKKHQVNSTRELIDIYTELGKVADSYANIDEDIQLLNQKIEKLTTELQVIGMRLHNSRSHNTPIIENEIQKLLVDVGMPNALFRIQLLQTIEPNIYGFNRIHFEIDTNKSGQFTSIGKSASGGELSRIALCIKSITAKAIDLPTLVFDEVDTGISGEVAKKVAQLLSQLSEHHQIICITHQPQVAAKGDLNYFVYKTEGDSGNIHTRIRTLKEEEKVLKIAEMIDGTSPSAAAIENAKHLILN